MIASDAIDRFVNALTAIPGTRKLGLRVEDYLLLDREGVFDDYAKTELIEGEIYAMNAQYSRHSRVKTRLTSAVNSALATARLPYEALTEVSVRLAADSMPEPDIVVTGYTGDDHVPAELVVLIVEVSDTTLDVDLTRKARLYARHGVPEYWVADVVTNVVHRMADADGDRYRQAARIAFGEPIIAATLPKLVVSTDTLR